MLTYWHWEAMLISNLAMRVIVLPFNDLAGLVQHPDYNILIKPTGYYKDLFQHASSPLWQEAYENKVKPLLDANVATDDVTGLMQTLMEQENLVLYDDYQAVE